MANWVLDFVATRYDALRASTEVDEKSASHVRFFWSCPRVCADSRSNVKSFPAGVQENIGYALYAAQLGERSVKAKPLHGLGGQVMEIVAYDVSGTYPAIYTVSIGESIYVIHAFQKKSKVTTPKPEMELIRQRLKQLRSEVKECRKERPSSTSPARATYSLTLAWPTPAST